MTTTEPVLENKDFVVFYKERGLATVPLKAGGGSSLLSVASSLFPEVGMPFSPNYWEGGVLHRLDTITSGLVLIARTRSFFDLMRKEQEEGRFIKRYRAKTLSLDPIEGFPPFDGNFEQGCRIESAFRAYGPGRKAVRPVAFEKIKPDDAIYSTKVEDIRGDEVFLSLSRGFRHQVRCHLAWCGHVITGDVLYGAPEGSFSLESYSISFLGQDVTI